MTLSATGMRDDIIDEIADPRIAGYTKQQALNAASGTQSIQAISAAVVQEISGQGRAALSFSTTGVCSNTVMTPGAFTGTITAVHAGTLSGLRAGSLKSDIIRRIEAAVDGDDFSVTNADRTIEAIAEAIVEEIHGQGRISSSRPENVTGTVVAGGGTPTGMIRITCKITNLNAGRLKTAFRTKIDQKISDDVNFGGGSADANLLALATGIVDHIQDHADVAIDTNFMGVTCLPSGGTGTGTGVSDSGARIS